MNSSNESLSSLGKKLLFFITIGIPLGLTTGLLRAYVTTVVWAWFLQPTFGIVLSIGAAYGIHTMYWLARGFASADRVAALNPIIKDAGLYQNTLFNNAISVFLSLVFLSSAYLFKLVIG